MEQHRKLPKRQDSKSKTNMQLELSFGKHQLWLSCSTGQLVVLFFGLALLLALVGWFRQMH